jgi:hypothetical protein
VEVSRIPISALWRALGDREVNLLSEPQRPLRSQIWESAGHAGTSRLSGEVFMADSLWPVIVGGLIAMGGVAISSTINVVMKRDEVRDQTKKARAAKFEKLVEAVYEFDHWMELKSNIKVHGPDEKMEVSPLARVEAISAVHFPQFATAIKNLVRTTLPYNQWMVNAAQKRIAGDATPITDGLTEAYVPYITARDALLDELKDFASGEFQAPTESKVTRYFSWGLNRGTRPRD